MLDIQFEGYDEALALFGTKKVDKAQGRSLNLAARKGRTEAGRLIRKRWNIKAKDVNQRLTAAAKAKPGQLSAEIVARSRPFSLSYFGAKYYRGTTVQTRKVGRRLKRASGRSGVYVQIFRGGPQTHLPHSFMTGLSSGHVGVFERIGKARLPIREERTITVASMFQQEQVYDPTVKLIGKVWQDEFVRQLSL